MAAPTFVQASTGATDASGTFTFTGVATGTIGDLVILQILNDGTGVISWGTLTNTNINKLDGTAGWDEIGIFFAGAAAQQRLFIGRRTSASSAPTFTASANTSGDDVYGRMYEFHDVSTGTALATVIENSVGDAVITQSVGATLYGLGTNAGTERLAQSFTAAGAISRVALNIERQGSPGDNVIVEIQTDAAGLPSGTVLASASISGMSLGEDPADVPFTTPCDLTAGTSYWIVGRRSGSVGGTNYYNWQGNAASVYAGGNAAYYDGTWHAIATQDRRFIVYGIPSTSGVTSSNTASDAAVTTLGPDRLALNFVAVNDDNAISAFTGETGGDWTLATAPYADSGGTDGAIGLQAAAMATANTIDGGTGSIVDIDSWGVVGFALIGTTPTPPTSRFPRNPAVNFQDPAYV